MAGKRKDSRGRNLRDGETQMPDGRYRFRYQDRNGDRQAVYSWRLVSTDKTPAGKRKSLSLREKEEAIAADSRDGIDSRTADKLTVNDMFTRYMGTKRDLKQSTIFNYEEVFRVYVTDTLGKMKISQVKYSDIKRHYNSLLDSGYKISTVYSVNKVLHPVFALAVRDGIIRTNPTDGVMREAKNAHSTEETTRHALTIPEQEAFINFVASSTTFRHWLPLFTFLLGTGCRIGEALGLTWDDCDTATGTISVNHTLLYKNLDGKGCKYYITKPKTAKGCRTIPMLQEVRKALDTEQRRQMKHGFSRIEIDGYRGFIFTTRNGTPHTTEEVNDVINRICKAYNKKETKQAEKEHREPLLIPKFSAHTLRHTFCTRFCENETNVKVIQEIMGHSDIKTTLNIYAEATEQKKQATFENLEGKIKIS